MLTTISACHALAPTVNANRTHARTWPPTGKYTEGPSTSDEVSVLIWPGCKIEHFPRGTTAGDLVRAHAGEGRLRSGEGFDGYKVDLLLNVNNRLVPESTVLNDGDLVILSRELMKI